MMAEIDVVPIDDVLGELQESICLTLATGPYQLGWAQTATAYLIDDDPSVSLTTLDGEASERGPNAGSIEISRSGGDLTAPLTVLLMSQGNATSGQDYNPISQSVTIPANQSSTTISVTPIVDGELEGTENVNVLLKRAGYRVDGSGSSWVRIYDDYPYISITATDGNASEDGTNPGQFTVTRSRCDLTPLLTIDYTVGGTAVSGEDYTALSGTLEIPGGSSSATITVSPVDDLEGELDESVIVSLDPGTYNIENGTAQLTIHDNESTVSIHAAQPAAEEQGTVPATFTVTRTGGNQTADLTVNYTVSGSASVADYQTLPGSVTIPANQSSVSFDVVPIDDPIPEGSESLTVNLGPGNYRLTNTMSDWATATIADNEPVVSINTTQPLATELNQEPGIFTITRQAADISQALPVTFTVIGTATEGEDYQSISTTATIPADQATVDILVTPVIDGVWEVTEDVQITLVETTDYLVASMQNSARLEILDDRPIVSISASDANADETSADPGAFTISRTGSTAVALTVSYTVVSSSSATANVDYVGLPHTITVPAGASSATIPVTPFDDILSESAETVEVVLSSASDYWIADEAKSALVTIADNDAQVSIEATDSNADEAASDPGTFTITRTGGDRSNPLTVLYHCSGTADHEFDYTGVPAFGRGAVTIPSGAGSTTLTVVPVDDPTAEPDESITIVLDANRTYSFDASSATVTLMDNEPRVTIVATDPEANEEGSDPAVFTVTRTGDTTNSLAVDYAMGGQATSGDYAALAGTVTIPVGSTSATITVTPVDDPDGEVDETVDISLVPAQRYWIPDAGVATATILDNEPRLSLAVTADLPMEGVSNGEFTVTRTGSLSGNLVVNYSVTGTAQAGTDYQTLPGSVTILSESATAIIPITLIDDEEGELDESLTLTIQAPSSLWIPPGSEEGTLTIRDDEARVILSMTQRPDEYLERPGIFVVSRTGDLSEPLTVNYAVTGDAVAGVDYTVPPGYVTISAESATAEIHIEPIDDGELEEDESLTVTIATGSGYGFATRATMSDAAMAAVGSSASSSSTPSSLTTTIINASIGKWHQVGEGTEANDKVTTNPPLAESGWQPVGYHGAWCRLPPRAEYRITFDTDLNTFDYVSHDAFYVDIAKTHIKKEDARGSNPSTGEFRWGGTSMGGLESEAERESITASGFDATSDPIYLNAYMRTTSWCAPTRAGLTGKPSYGSFDFNIVDLDVDSLNNDTMGTKESDKAEDDSTKPGKWIAVNSRDLDNNGVPGFADGIDLHDNSAASPYSEKAVAKMKLSIPVFADPSTATITISHPADADPSSITSPTGTSGYEQPDAGLVTIWTEDAVSDGSFSRKHAEVTAGGHWVKAGHPYKASELGFDASFSDRTFYIEGIHPSAGIPGDYVEVTFCRDGTASSATTDKVYFTVIDVDIDMDSDNSRAVRMGPDGTSAEDQCEEQSGLPGKYVQVNHGDADGDTIRDYVDGFGIRGAGGLCYNQDLNNASVNFTPLVLTIPAPIDLSQASITFVYDGSDPSAISINAAHPENNAPAAGRIRIWLKDGDQQRFTNRGDYTGTNQDDYVEPGKVYLATELGFTAGSTGPRSKTFYVEGIEASPAKGIDDIKVEVRPTGYGFCLASDLVRYTSYAYKIEGKIEYDPAAVKPVRGAHVFVKETDTYFGTVLGETYTKEDGTYTIYLFAPAPTFHIYVEPSNSGAPSVSRTVDVRNMVAELLPGIEPSPTTEHWYNFTPAAGASVTNANAEIKIDVTGASAIPSTNVIGQAFWVYDASITGARMHAKLPGIGAGNMPIGFPSPGLKTSLTPLAPFIKPTDWSDWDTIIHEYGHSVQQWSFFYPNTVPYFNHQLGRNNREKHGTTAPGVFRLGFSEGWANFYTMLAQSEIGVSTPAVAGAGSPLAISDGRTSWCPESNAVPGYGEDEEISNMRILWDLYDSGADSVTLGGGHVLTDNIAIGYEGVFNILKFKGLTVQTSTLWSALASGAPNDSVMKYGAIFEMNHVSPTNLAFSIPGAAGTAWSQSTHAGILPVFQFEIPLDSTGTIQLLDQFGIKVFDHNFVEIYDTADTAPPTNPFLASGPGIGQLNDTANPNVKQFTPILGAWNKISSVQGTKYWVVYGREQDTGADGYWSDKRVFTIVP